MVSPGTLRTVSKLTDGEQNAFEPSIGERGEITYPPVERSLDEQDGRATDFLETMADRGILAAEFEYKVYICPNCALEGMQYSTGCPDCGSVHATREPAAVHPSCGTTFGRDRSSVEGNREQADELPCPGCEEDVSVDDLEQNLQYRCHDCDGWFESPTHRLWCRDCHRVYPPVDVREEAVYRYPLTDFGTRWITEQVEGRRLLVEAIESRGYETSVDTAVSTSANGELPVHVYAVDDLFDARIVAGVHESPTVDDVQRLVEAAREVDARPILLVTDGSVDGRVAELIDSEGVTIVSVSDGTLSDEFDISERAHEPTPIFDWLDSLFSSTTAKR